MERKQETKRNQNGSYVYVTKETIRQTPEDGFVADRIMEPTNPDAIGKYHKGYRTTVTYTTNDPRITRLFAYGICGFFLVIGIVLLLCRDWLLAVPFIAISLFGLYRSKKDIDAVADELKEKDQDVTIDSKEELKEAAEEVADMLHSGFEEAGKATFTKESYQWFLKATIPVYAVIALLATAVTAVFAGIVLAAALLILLALVGVFYYKMIKKIFKY